MNGSRAGSAPGIATPPLLIGASLLAWGWQTGQWPVAVALALAVEATRRVRVRFELGADEHSRIADLCTVAFVGITVLFAVNRGIAHGILAAFQWLPVALSPILVAQFVSVSRRVPLSALFRYLRRLKREFPETLDPPVDASPVYVAITLLAAGIASAQSAFYATCVIGVTALGLRAVRPQHARQGVWALLLVAAAAIGAAGHTGLVRLQGVVENWVSDWYLRGLSGNPYRATTDIGSIGKLKLSDEIALRVFAPPGEANRPALLHRASYNVYVGTTWLARGAPMQPVDPDADRLGWRLAAAPADRSVRVAARIQRGRLLLSLPADTVRVAGLAATGVTRNALGAVHAEIAGDWIQYETDLARGADLAAAPAELELALPPPERATFIALAEGLGLHGLPAAAAFERVRSHFFTYRYAIWSEREPTPGRTPLAEFVRESRAGHCEYFAAATVLLLRAAGIPARYATGYAVMEYSPLEGAWLVRSRHAHAWARAWDGARWVDLDTTPPDWLPEEAKLAPFWSRFADLTRWAAFRWSQRGEFEASDAWYGVLALLVAVLAWRLLRGKRVAARPDATQVSPRAWPGADSEFHALAQSLPAREAAESLPAWFRRVSPPLPGDFRARLAQALALHQRYRFDPAGVDAAERRKLREICHAPLARE